MVLAVATGDVLMGALLLVFAAVFLASVAGAFREGPPNSTMERNQVVALGVGFLGLGLERLTSSVVFGVIGLIGIVTAAFFMLQRYRAGESVFSLRRH